MQILIVEDEKRLAEVLGQLCREQRWQADVVYTGADGLEYARSGQYDAVVLDVMLPGMDGFEVVRTLRREKIATPVLMLTARDEVRDKVTAAALASGRETGTLADPALRYLCQAAPDGLRIAFADRSSELAAIRRMAAVLAAAGLLALAAFGAVSVFLARWALRPVEQTWQQQRQFVADASHELKTPLTVILASASLMASHPEQTVAAQRQWLDSIREEGARMKQLIEDLLFLARADALQPPVFSAVDWSEVTESAALAFESVSFEKGIALDADIAPGLTVQGSAPQLTQLTEILLDNACKYTGGSRYVTLMLRAAGGDGVLTVSNTGDTLSAEQLSRLFERFYRADPARSAGGHGLGLAIAQTIAQTHRGRIRAQSAGGVTTLTVTLPLASGNG